MKPKPLKHKEENTFRFETFHERLQKINISSINHLKRRLDSEDQDKDLSFFAIAIDKWQELNLSNDYKELRGRLGSYLNFQTLPQVLHRKDELAKILIDGLKERKQNSLSPNLDLLVALTRDLQSDFYPHFDDCYKILIDLTCEVTDTESIESIFVCLTFLFKHLWKNIADDVEHHFETTKKALLTKKDHIVFFASEVFSFIIKKSKTPKAIIELLFDSVNEDDELSKGVGRIFFELVKGVNKAFVSKCQQFFDMIFNNFLGHPLLYFVEAMKYFVEYCCQHCTKESFKPLWSFLMPKVIIVEPSYDPEHKFCKLIPLLCQAIEFHRCKLVHDPNLVLETVISYISDVRLSLHQYLKNILLNSLEKMFEFCDSCLSIDSVQSFCRQLFSEKLYIESRFVSDDSNDSPTQFLSIVYQFVLNISHSTTFLFDIHVNRSFTQFVSKVFQKGSIDQQEVSLEFLASMFQKKRPKPELGSELYKIQKYPLQFQDDEQRENVLNFVRNRMKKPESTDEFVYLMIVLSNISTSGEGKNDLMKISKFVMERIDVEDQFCGVMLVESVCALSLMQPEVKEKDSVGLGPERIVELVVQHPTNRNYLLALDLYFAIFPKSLSNKAVEESLFTKLYPILSANLESYDRQIRLLSLHILTQFKYQMADESLSTSSGSLNIFQICLDAEQVPIELSQYRERLKHVRKLDCNYLKSYLPKPKCGHDFSALPVRYLLGSLYENLTLLWKPTLEVIETFVQYSTEKKTVVEILFEHFKLTTNIIKSMDIEEAEKDSSMGRMAIDDNDEDNEDFNGDTLCDKEILAKIVLFPMLNIQVGKNNFDHANHRLQLLRGFEMFSDVVEPRNREFVEMFFNFLTTEMKSVTIYMSNNRESLRKNLDQNKEVEDEDKKDDKKDNDENEEEDDEDEEEEEEEEKPSGRVLRKDTKKAEEAQETEDKLEEEEEPETEEIEEVSEKKSFMSKSSLWKTYFSFLNVFAKFKNPKACFREPELLQMYLNMLVSPNTQIQKSAMNCLYTYNHDYLNKYKDNFNRLLDDKTFTSEIHSFTRRDNPEDNTVHENDREKVIPTFLRILFGKMLASSGTKKHGKSRIDFLRSVILKTVASFSEDEQRSFMDLIYLSLQSLLASDYDNLHLLLDEFIDVDSFMPLKQFQSLITTLESLVKHLGGRSETLMKYMFKVLVVCSSIVSRLLRPEVRCVLKPFVIKTLKTFRINCFKVTSYFFGHFDQYPFTEVEIDSLFSTLLKPLLITLKTDSEESPSPLLKLLHIWCENPRFYCLLAKHCSEDLELTPIQAIIQLYSHNDKISQSTSTYITGMIENLLTYDSDLQFLYSDSQNRKIPPLTINNFGHKLPDLKDYPELKNMKVNFGSVILVPFIKDILYRINSNREKYDFTLQEINVLARLSFFVKDPEDSYTFCSLLLHSISGVKRPEEDKEVFTLKTLNHLAKSIPAKEFENILALIIPLFYLVDKPLSRRELASFLDTLTDKKPEFKDFSVLIVEINAYDQRFAEEPDFNRRIDAFKKVTTFLNSFKLKDQNEFDFIHLLLNNCSFFLNKFEDLSLKELSSNVLLKVCEIFKDSEPQLFSRYVVNLLFLKMVSNGLKHEKESVRHDYLDILWNCLKVLKGTEHPLIEQMIRLINLEDDEIDFYRNMKHIQLHRRARALTRLMYNTELLEGFSSKIFIHFLIPIANSFVTDPQLPVKNMALFGASVDALATFLQYCGWYKYESTLMYYFNGLLNGKVDAKVSVKVISALLSKFTFLKPEMVKKIEMDLKGDDFKLISIEYSEISSNTKRMQKYAKKGKKGKKEKAFEVSKEVKVPETVSQEVNDNNEAMEVDEETPVDQEKEDQMFTQRKKIYDSLCKKLLPMLHRCLHQRSETDYSKDKHHDLHPEQEEIQRIPLALAIVKLLKHVELNAHLFQTNITSIFLRLCQFLQSRALPIREASRGTLVQIMKTLGPKYFHQIFMELNSLLTRGYQKHILIFTIHVLLTSLTDQFQKGDLDSSMKGIIDLCNQELFGLLGDEKEISQITTKTKEAQKLKSYDIYEILGKFVSERALDNLIQPLKNSLMEATKNKVLKKVEEALYKIGRGLVANKWLSEATIMNMVCRILTETRPDTEVAKDMGKMGKLSEILPKRVDYMLINQKALRRVDHTAKINRKSHMHLLSNFALTCFRFMLKNNRFHKENDGHCQVMEPTIEILRVFLFSNDVSVITTTLFCFHELLMRFPDLKSFADVTQSIVSQIFVLLKKYSGMNSDNSQLIALCFKSIAHFVNLREESKLSSEEIAVLLSFAENEMEHNSQNATVYYLLGAIIRRKLVSKEMHILMEKMADLAVTTEIDVVRSNCINLSVKYLTEFPIEANRFKGKITRLIRNLEYKTTVGRISAGTILRSVINQLPYSNLVNLKLELFVPISARLVNEDDSEVKKLVSDTVRNILTKLTREDRLELWQTFVVPWLESEEMLIWTLGSKLCSVFLQVEGKEFAAKIGDCLPLIAKQLKPDGFTSFKAQKKSLANGKSAEDEDEDDDDDDDDDEEDEDEDEDEDNDNEDDDDKAKQSKLEDDLIFQHLTFIMKLLKFENVQKLLLKFHTHFNTVFHSITSDFLLHPHSWVRSLSTQIFGQLFSLFPPEMFMDKKLNKQHFLFSENSVVPELTKKFCLIFRDLYSCPAVQEQLVKNLVYVGRVYILLDQGNVKEEEEQKSRLTSLISRMIFEVKFEIKNHPNQFDKRIFLFKWIAAIAIQLGQTGVVSYLHKLLPPLCREELSSLSETVGSTDLNGNRNNRYGKSNGKDNGHEEEEMDDEMNGVDLEDMKQKRELLMDLNKQVLQIIKKLVGSDCFVEHYNKARNELSSMRLERKKNRAIQMVNDVATGVKRKQRKHRRDRSLKKKRFN